MSWLCVAAYLTATLCSLRAFAARAPDRHPKARSFWLLLAIGLVGLGINKPLDLHDLAIQVGRDLSIAEGWYAERRIVLGACLLAAAGAGAVGAVWLHRRLHPLSREMRLAFGSFAALAGLLLLRGSPFPIVADLLTLPLLSKEDGLFHIHFSEVLELLILVAIAVAARRTARGRPSDRNGG